MKKNHFPLLCAVMSLLLLLSCAQEEVKPTPKPAKIALVLGAGSSRGFAHIGVLKVLETNKIPIHMIVGTSVGSFVGSLYASGFDSFQLQKLSFSIKEEDIIDTMLIPDQGFVKGEKIEEFINKAVMFAPLEKMNIPFFPVATDIQSGKEVIFVSGETGLAVRASCAIPGIFRPVTIRDRMYVDGGVVSPVAVDTARRLGADVVIAVDISSSIDNNKPESIIDTVLQSINIMYSNLAQAQLARADIVIAPKVGYIGSRDFSKRHEAVLEGEKAALEALPALQDIISRLRLEGRLE